MHLQDTPLDERLSTGLAAEGTLAGVYPLMSFQSVSLVEAFSTRLAAEGLFPRVYAQVPLQVTLDGEAFITVLAVIGSLSSVDPLVHLQAVGSVETLAALLTAERPDFCMETLVVSQQLLQGKTLPTNIAGVWSLTCMTEQQNMGHSLIKSCMCCTKTSSKYIDWILFLYVCCCVIITHFSDTLIFLCHLDFALTSQLNNCFVPCCIIIDHSKEVKFIKHKLK